LGQALLAWRGFWNSISNRLHHFLQEKKTVMSNDILEYIKDSVDRIESKIDRHDDRIITVERWQSNAEGKVTMVGIFGSLVGGLVVWLTSLLHK
jgi:hypothetical protein